MPIPKPTEAETQAEFVPRCMADESMTRDYGDREQRAAVCYTAWRKHEAGKSLATGEPDRDTRYVKSVPDAKLSAKAVEQGKSDSGWIEGYSAAFGNVDRQDERIIRGAFAKTIAERVAAGKVKLSARHYAHGGDTMEIIGLCTEAREDDYGLWSHFELSSAALAQDVRAKVLEGMVSSMSVGYMPKRWEDVEEGGLRVRNLTECAWLETTITAMPANELAVITAAKPLRDSADTIRMDDPRSASVLEAMRNLSAELDALIRGKESQPEAQSKTLPQLRSWQREIELRRNALERLTLDI